MPLNMSSLASFSNNIYCPELKLFLSHLSRLELLKSQPDLVHTTTLKPSSVLDSDEHWGNVCGVN